MSQKPDGMISAADFAAEKNISEQKVIEMIQKGFFEGRKVGEDWYVKDRKSNKTASNSSADKLGYKSEYETARNISMFLIIIGWVGFAIGIITSLAALISGSNTPYGGGLSILSTLPGLIMSVSGLFLVASGQVTQALVDNADHTREILKLLQSKN